MALPYTFKVYGREAVKRRIKKNLNCALNSYTNSTRVQLVVNKDDVLKRIGRAIRNYHIDSTVENTEALLHVINNSGLPIHLFSHLESYLCRFIQCECCNKYVIEASPDSASICQPCLNDYYSYSEIMDMYIHNDEICHSEDGIATEYWFQDNGYVYCDESGQFVEKYKAWPNHILNYHESKHYIGKIDDEREDKQVYPLYCGFELELEGSSHYDGDSDEYDRTDDELSDIADNITKALRNTNDKRCYICAEEDGSLNNGFELVSSYTGIDTHWSRLQNFDRISSIRNEDVHDDTNAGLHVHVSRNKLSLYTCAKIASFMSSPLNERFLNKFARRSPNSYWKRKTKSELTESFRNARRRGISNLNEDRYEIVNFHNRHTIEFRLYRSSTSANTIMACIEFSRAVVAYCRIAGLHQLTIEDLIKWVYRPENKLDTLRLRLYLKRYFPELHNTYAPVEKPNRRPEKLVAMS